MSRRGYKCKPKKTKVRKWMQTMDAVLTAERLRPGDASKLAGRLSWGASKLFRLTRREQNACIMPWDV